MPKILIAQDDGIHADFDGFSDSYNYILPFSKKNKPIKYYYISENGETIHRKKEKREKRVSSLGLARLAIQIFKPKLDALSETDRNALKTDGYSNKDNIGFWSDKDEFLQKKTLKFNHFSIQPYKDNENISYYFYNRGLHDSLNMCLSLLKYFDDAGTFVIEYNNIEL